MKSIKKLFLPAVVMLALVVSCRRESPSWDVDVLAPLVKSTLTIHNIIPDSLPQTNPDNSLDIVYKTGLYSFNTDTLFNVPDTSLIDKYVSPLQGTIGPGQYIVPVTSEIIDFTNGVAQLKKIALKEGKMTLSFVSSIKEKVLVTYQLPGLFDPSGKSFDTTVTVAKATASAPGTFTGIFDLSNYMIDLTGANGSSVNKLEIKYSSKIDPLASAPALIEAGDSVIITNSFNDIIVKYAKGYFGSTVDAAIDTSAFALFSHVVDGSLSLEQVDIDFSIENSVGADARITINELASINSRTGNPVVLSHDIINSPININRAVDNNGNVGPSLYSFDINTGNSNINAFIENLPDKLAYNMDFEINPLGNVSGSNDFIYYDKLLKTEMNMVIPLSLVANNLTLADTLDFSLDESTNNVNHGTLYLYAENGFPFTAQAQLYIMNDNLQVIDSLISAPNSIAAPPLNGNFICVGKKFTKLAIPVDASKMELLRNTKKMYVKIKFNTAAQPSYVKIYSFYELNVKLIADFNYTIGKKN